MMQKKNVMQFRIKLIQINLPGVKKVLNQNPVAAKRIPRKVVERMYVIANPK